MAVLKEVLAGEEELSEDTIGLVGGQDSELPLCMPSSVPKADRPSRLVPSTEHIDGTEDYDIKKRQQEVTGPECMIKLAETCTINSWAEPNPIQGDSDRGTPPDQSSSAEEEGSEDGNDMLSALLQMQKQKRALSDSSLDDEEPYALDSSQDEGHGSSILSGEPNTSSQSREGDAVAGTINNGEDHGDDSSGLADMLAANSLEDKDSGGVLIAVNVQECDIEATLSAWAQYSSERQQSSFVFSTLRMQVRIYTTLVARLYVKEAFSHYPTVVIQLMIQLASTLAGGKQDQGDHMQGASHRKAGRRKGRKKASNPAADTQIGMDGNGSSNTRSKMKQHQKNSDNGDTNTCSVCGVEFASRTKMFQHIQTMGHAALHWGHWQADLCRLEGCLQISSEQYWSIRQIQ